MLQVTLCDRDYRITEDRFLARLEPEVHLPLSVFQVGQIFRSRDKVMARRLQALPGLVVAVVGRRHLEGLPLKLQQAIDPVEVDALCQPVQLPLWRRVMGQPILWRLRGTFGKRLLD
eukprot:Skav236724  [mRNA]  locus=scaffold2023:83734:86116:- [translate_table: standard]